jgi:hypothetical protein
MGVVLDGYYLCIQLSRMSLEFLNALSVCWKHVFRANGDFLEGLCKVGEEEEMFVTEGKWLCIDIVRYLSSGIFKGAKTVLLLM